MPMKSQHDCEQSYLVLSPTDDRIEIPEELFLALSDFLKGPRPSGSIVIHFRNGGIAGLEALVKRKYK